MCAQFTPIYILPSMTHILYHTPLDMLQGTPVHILWEVAKTLRSSEMPEKPEFRKFIELNEDTRQDVLNHYYELETHMRLHSEESCCIPPHHHRVSDPLVLRIRCVA